jgi:hypothetical protein
MDDHCRRVAGVLHIGSGYRSDDIIREGDADAFTYPNICTINCALTNTITYAHTHAVASAGSHP